MIEWVSPYASNIQEHLDRELARLRAAHAAEPDAAASPQREFFMWGLYDTIPGNDPRGPIRLHG